MGDSMRSENSFHLELEKKKLYKQNDAKMNDLMHDLNEYKGKYEQVQTKWDENEEKWNEKFDLVVAERNRLKNKTKSLQNDLSEYLNHKNSSVIIAKHPSTDAYEEEDEEKD